MERKILKKAFSDRLKKALIVGAAFLTLGGAQKAQAQGLLEKITNAIENVNHEVNQVNIKISNYNIQRDRLKRNAERFNRNTGGAIGGVISLITAQKMVKQQVKQSGGTYVAPAQEFSQTNQSATQSRNVTSTNAQYLKSVQSKLSQKQNVQNQEVKVERKKNQTKQSYTQEELNVASLLGLDVSR